MASTGIEMETIQLVLVCNGIAQYTAYDLAVSVAGKCNDTLAAVHRIWGKDQSNLQNHEAQRC